jgi:hypothetical protein
MPENGLWTNPYYCQNSYVECEEHVAGDGEDVRFKDRVAQVTKSQGEVVCRRLERGPREETDLDRVSLVSSLNEGADKQYRWAIDQGRLWFSKSL